MNHYPQLDGLRAFAVLAVIAGHAANSSDPNQVRHLALGFLGVRLFFVLSGFLITGILLHYRKRFDANSALRKIGLVKAFFGRRFLRIFPVYYLTLAAFALFGLSKFTDHWWWHVSYLSNFYFASGGVGGPPVSHLWTLAVEEQFYLFWPFLVLFVPTKHLNKVFVVAILTAMVYRGYAVLNDFPRRSTIYPVYACLDSFGMGAVLAAIILGNVGQLKEKLGGWSLPVGIVAILLVAGSITLKNYCGDPVFISIGQSVAAIGFAGIVLGAVVGFPTLIGTFLASKPIGYIGKISYAMYLFHFPIDRIVLKQWDVSYEFLQRFEYRFVVVTLISVFLASVSWYFFEKPLNDLKRYFPYEPSDDKTDS